MKRQVLWTTSLLALLAGCGQRGDLYFPEARREAVITVPAQAPPPVATPDATAGQDNEEAATGPNTTQPAATQPDAIVTPPPGNVGQ
jgi:predicted small lipoprotein YifL